MSSWKKLLKEETERSVKNLKLSDEVRNAPVSVREKQETIPTKTGILTRIAAGVASFFGKVFQMLFNDYFIIIYQSRFQFNETPCLFSPKMLK